MSGHLCIDLANLLRHRVYLSLKRTKKKTNSIIFSLSRILIKGLRIANLFKTFLSFCESPVFINILQTGITGRNH
jgi:hypothetical protein